MNVICVDDEKLSLDHLVTQLQSLPEVRRVDGFLSADDALGFLRGNTSDAAFLDIQMPNMNGLELAKRMKDLDGGIRVIFVTGYSQYALDAFKLHASGYVMKPVDTDVLRTELDHIGPRPKRLPHSRIRVQCFGNFEVFVDDTPLSFSRSKAKELFAYLVYRRGALCTVRELAAVLFEDTQYSSLQLNYIQKIISSMRKAFKQFGLADGLFIRRYNGLSLNTDCIDCDFYRFLRWDTDAVNTYAGEFMAQYSWAEFVCGYLDQKLPAK